jgi:hypothetical protein
MKLFVGSEDNFYYRMWLAIKHRCCNPKNPGYRNYGGRGIKIYQGWLDDWRSFVCYIIDELGERPDGKSIDRIDNDGDYVPGNLQWETRSGQNRNRRHDKPGLIGKVKDYPLGKTGIRWVRQSGKSFIGQFYTQGKKYNTKVYPTAEEAYRAVIQLRIEIGVELP